MAAASQVWAAATLLRAALLPGTRHRLQGRQHRHQLRLPPDDRLVHPPHRTHRPRGALGTRHHILHRGGRRAAARHRQRHEGLGLRGSVLKAPSWQRHSILYPGLLGLALQAPGCATHSGRAAKTFRDLWEAAVRPCGAADSIDSTALNTQARWPIGCCACNRCAKTSARGSRPRPSRACRSARSCARRCGSPRRREVGRTTPPYALLRRLRRFRTLLDS